MFKKIVVPYDGSSFSKKAIPVAVEIAKSMDAEITILLVVQPVPIIAPDFTGNLSEIYVEMKKGALRQANTVVEPVIAELKEAGISARSLVEESSDVASGILDIITYLDSDLVVMSTHGRTGISRFLLGNVAHRVVHHAQIPVLLVRPEETE